MLTGEMLRRSAYRFPDKPAILWNGTSLSYRDLDARANQLAHALLGLGLKPGAKVAMLSRNRPEYGIVFFGAVAHRLRPGERVRALRRGGALLRPRQGGCRGPDLRGSVRREGRGRARSAAEAQAPDRHRREEAGCDAVQRFHRGPAVGRARGDDLGARPVLHDLYGRHDRPAQGRALQPPQPRRDGAYGDGRGGDRRARHRRHRDADVPCRGAEHHVPARDPRGRHDDDAQQVGGRRLRPHGARDRHDGCLHGADPGQHGRVGPGLRCRRTTRAGAS